MDSSKRVAFYSVIFNIFLVALKYLLAYLSGSLALIAEVIHSLSDVIASMAIFIGIKISKRRSPAFPDFHPRLGFIFP
ncbi:MAG: cation transporter [Candidatus Desulfofervidaceae bacterium]|nr:cation transporter [Candidatus Desulfofervidaceae bacterium]